MFTYINNAIIGEEVGQQCQRHIDAPRHYAITIHYITAIRHVDIATTYMLLLIPRVSYAAAAYYASHNMP